MPDHAMMLYLESDPSAAAGIAGGTPGLLRLGSGPRDAACRAQAGLRAVDDRGHPVQDPACRSRSSATDRWRPPRIAVASLNPHAGEDGLFGDEERELIAPAVARARQEGIDSSGPFPNDTLFHQALGGSYDAVVAMYHDQGHIALKTAGFRRAVNVTLGLPIVRTSVAHGTAFDIAWKGLADPSSLIEAVRIAARMKANPGLDAGALPAARFD